MAGIGFDNYEVNELSFVKNPEFDQAGKVVVKTDFKCIINILSDELAEVFLVTKIGDISKSESPFEVNVSIVGDFTYNSEESNGIAFEKYLSENAIAILFPYLRQLVANLTLTSNKFPPLVLPVINVVKMLEDKKAIEINKLY